MNILHLYNASQTYTGTVYEHIDSFAKYSRFSSFFCHVHAHADLELDFSRFDAVAIHYTIRLPFDQVSDSVADALARYRGLKFLFIQDEYDHTHRTWYWIKRLGIRLVFTVAPEHTVQRVYPAEEFPGVRFVSCLTGYVPDGLKIDSDILPASRRDLIVGYRGRPLPVRYGKLGFEKVAIGQIVREHCVTHHIPCDIAWTEEARIYGSKWYDFLRSCRSMLGSESGSNVFDWDGSLQKRIEEYRSKHRTATEQEIYKALVEPLEVEGAMNQVSPRIFETIAAGSALVLFEGDYSGVVKPDQHYISLKKDGSNLGEVFRLLDDPVILDSMTARAYQDVIASGKYSYEAFVIGVDEAVNDALRAIDASNSETNITSLHPTVGAPEARAHVPASLTTHPIRATPVQTPLLGRDILSTVAYGILRNVWPWLPSSMRTFLRPKLAHIRKLLRS